MNEARDFCDRVYARAEPDDEWDPGPADPYVFDEDRERLEQEEDEEAEDDDEG
jgi:hypothetical protein